jgi:periplasmic divalent cation tolerance protein
MAQYGVVLVTIDDEERGQAIAAAIVEARLAACVNLFPIQSIYRWQGEVQCDRDWQLVIKTDLAQYPALATKIQSLHPYDLPEIIALPISQGSDAYLGWISAQVDGTGAGA